MSDFIDNVRKFWWKWLTYIVSLGVVGLSVSSLVLDKKITISVMNSWVGLVLGLVATVLSVISMVLSFYNLDQSIHTQEKTIEKMDLITKEIINRIESSAEKTQKTVEKKLNFNSDNNKQELLLATNGDNNIK